MYHYQWVVVSRSSFLADNIPGMSVDWGCVMSQVCTINFSSGGACPARPALSHEETGEVIRARDEDRHSTRPATLPLQSDTRTWRPRPRSATSPASWWCSSPGSWDRTNILTEACMSSISWSFLQSCPSSELIY